MGRPRKWTRDTVLQAIQLYALHHGEAPASMDFARCTEGLPHHKTVWEHFPSVHVAVAQAGFARNRQGLEKRQQNRVRLQQLQAMYPLRESVSRP